MVTPPRTPSDVAHHLEAAASLLYLAGLCGDVDDRATALQDALTAAALDLRDRERLDETLVARHLLALYRSASQLAFQPPPGLKHDCELITADLAQMIVDLGLLHGILAPVGGLQ
jgi:hypothetical protein